MSGAIHARASGTDTPEASFPHVGTVASSVGRCTESEVCVNDYGSLRSKRVRDICNGTVTCEISGKMFSCTALFCIFEMVMLRSRSDDP